VMKISPFWSPPQQRRSAESSARYIWV